MRGKGFVESPGGAEGEEWSGWIRERFQGREAVFEFKLLRLSRDLREFRLYRIYVFATVG